MYKSILIGVQIVCLVFTLSITPANAQSLFNKEKMISDLIARAEGYYKQGAAALAEGNYAGMRGQFDQAVDVLITSGIDLQSDARLQQYYRELVDRIVMQQLALQSQQANSEQKFVGKPNDILLLTDSELEQQAVATPVSKAVEQSDFSFKPTLHAPVNQFINYFVAGKGRKTLETGFMRSAKYRAYAEQIFAEHGVPTELIWLAQVESVWQPVASSPAAARGIWQFIPATGSRFGLRQDSWVDERLDPEKSTIAAAKYLRYLGTHFGGDWLLAMAAYNCGENGLERAIQRAGYADFWVLREKGMIPQETRNYVPAILAVIAIAKHPENYGVSIAPADETEFERQSMPGGASLRTVASALNLSEDTLTSLNPELVANSLPPGGYAIRVPKGSEIDLARLEISRPKQSYQTQTVAKKSSRYQTRSAVKRQRR